jgi:FtsP/CotA-like multicopper oxidase with cupredoxin domain
VSNRNANPALIRPPSSDPDHNLALQQVGVSRRGFLRGITATTASLLAAPLALGGQPAAGPPDFRIEISEVEWELSPKKKIKTSAFNGQIPGRVLRLKEGAPVTIEIANKLDHPDIVHWHGQWIPSCVDGSVEEGTPTIAPGDTQRISFTPRPSGLHWYHTHTMAHRDLKRALYSGEFGALIVEPRNDPARYDHEQILVLHDWEPYLVSSDDGSEMVNYVNSTINGKMLGHDDPIRVHSGDHVLFQIINASATEAHWLSLPGHQFQVIALDGRPVPTPAKADVLRLGPAERISAIVEMNAPGVWILGEARTAFRDAGMGTVIEYANQSRKPDSGPAAKLEWDYRRFADPSAGLRKPDVSIPLTFTSRFEGHGALDRWMINGKSFSDADPIPLKNGLRHRLIFQNPGTDDHPVHLHRHAFELVSLRGVPTSGVFKDVVVVEAKSTVAVDLVANNPGNTLFHCHQQDHMDSGFMRLFKYDE